MTENTWVSLGLYLVGRPPLWSTPIFKAANRLLEVWDNCVLPSTPNPEPWNTRSWDKVPYVFPNTSWKGLVFWVCFFLGSSHNSHTSKPKVFVLSLGRCRILTDKIDVIESSHLEGNSRAGEAVSRVNNFCFRGWCFICGFMLFELTSFIFPSRFCWWRSIHLDGFRTDSILHKVAASSISIRFVSVIELSQIPAPPEQNIKLIEIYNIPNRYRINNDPELLICQKVFDFSWQM